MQSARSDVVIDFGHQRLDRGDIFADHPVVLIFVDHPGRFQHEQFELFQLNIAVGDVHLHRLLVGNDTVACFAADRSPAHKVQRFFASANRPHRVMNSSATEARLRYHESPAALSQQVIARHPHVGVAHIGFTTVLTAVDAHVADDLNARRIRRHNEHRHAAVRWIVWIGHCHHDQKFRPAAIG